MGDRRPHVSLFWSNVNIAISTLSTVVVLFVHLYLRSFESVMFKTNKIPSGKGNQFTNKNLMLSVVKFVNGMKR